MPESFGSLRGQPNAAGPVVLWRREFGPTFGAGARPLHGERSAIQVYVIPAKPKKFTLPQPRMNSYDVQRSQPVALRGF
jgi:hypothetical protein